MQSTKKLTVVLRELLSVIDEEASRNPAFASKVEALMAPYVPPQRQPRKQNNPDIPDVFAALREKGETEFPFWLRSLDLPTLKAIVRANGFDPAKSSIRWTDPDKFVSLISEQSLARMRRGSAFLPPKNQPEAKDP